MFGKGNLRTIGPRGLLARPQGEERPPLRLEAEVALERGHAFVHRRELVLVARAEGRSLCGIVGVECEEGGNFLAGRPREVQIAQIAEELIVSAVIVR